MRLGTVPSGDRTAVQTTESSSLLNFQIICRAHSATYSMGSFQSIRWPKREADHSPLSIAEVKTRGAIFPLLYAFQVCTGTTEKGKASPLQAWTGPQVSRRLRIPDFKTIGT